MMARSVVIGKMIGIFADDASFRRFSRSCEECSTFLDHHMKRISLIGTASLTVSLLATTAFAGGLAQPIREVGAVAGQSSSSCPVVEPVVRALQRQGFTRFEVDANSEQARITAIRGSLLNEFIYDCRTGAVLGQSGSRVDWATAPGMRFVQGQDDEGLLSARPNGDVGSVAGVATARSRSDAQRSNPNDVNGDGRVDWRDDINGDGRIDDVDRSSPAGSSRAAALDPNDVNGDGKVDHGDDINGDGRIDDVDRGSSGGSRRTADLDPNDVNGDGRVDHGDDVNGDGRIDDVDRSSSGGNGRSFASERDDNDRGRRSADLSPARAASDDDDDDDHQARQDRRDRAGRGAVSGRGERPGNGRCQDAVDDTSGDNPDENAPHDNCGLGNSDDGTDPDNPAHGDNPAPGQSGGRGNGQGTGNGNGQGGGHGGGQSGGHGDGKGSGNGGSQGGSSGEGQGTDGRLDNTDKKGRNNGRCQDDADDTSGSDPDENAPNDNCGLGNSDDGTDPDNPAHGDNPAPGQAGDRDAGKGAGNGGQSGKQGEVDDQSEKSKKNDKADEQGKDDRAGNHGKNGESGKPDKGGKANNQGKNDD
jgi:hypothetical protein